MQRALERLVGISQLREQSRPNDLVNSPLPAQLTVLIKHLKVSLAGCVRFNTDGLDRVTSE